MSPIRGLCAALFLTIPFRTVLADNTYWIDSSCNGLLDHAVDEAFKTAGKVNARLSKSADEEPQAFRALHAIFGDASGNAMAELAYQEVLKTVGTDYANSLQKFTLDPHTDQDEARQAAEIRIYCDNDERWDLVRDDPNQKEGTVNSAREDKDKEWLDAVNQIRTKGTPVCRVPGTTTGAVTYGTWVKGVSSTNQHPERTTITICNWYLQKKDRIRTWSGVEYKKNFFSTTTPTIDALRHVTSNVIYHELFHHSRFGMDDVPLVAGDPQSAYNWENVKQMDPLNAMSNADSHSILGILIRSLDRKFALVKDDPKSGRLFYDAKVPDSAVILQQGAPRRRTRRKNPRNPRRGVTARPALIPVVKPLPQW